MSRKKRPLDSAPRSRKRKMRSRPTPKWLTSSKDLNEIARRRCILILSVLSGEKPVSEAIEEADITRPLYYQLEEKALAAMLEALTPGTPGRGRAGVTTSAKVQELEEKIARLERDKRRSERLLLLTRKIMKPGPHKAAPGRPRKKRSSPSSITTVKKSSKGSKTKASIKAPTGSPPVANLTPTKDGAGEP